MINDYLQCAECGALYHKESEGCDCWNHLKHKRENKPIRPLSEDDIHYLFSDHEGNFVNVVRESRLRELVADTVSEIDAAIETAHIIENEDVLLTLINIKDNIKRRFAPLMPSEELRKK